MVQADTLKDIAIVICGPTGSGKTRLAVEIAQKYDGEVISADSIAVYRGLNIGAAKPTEAEMHAVRHHMIDVVDPSEEFSVAEYKEGARKCLYDILDRKKTPVICGGTGYYIDAVLYDLSYGNCPKNPQVRSRLEQTASDEGLGVLYERLKIVDPETAAVVSMNDKMRIVRALEIYECTGLKKSSFVDKKQPIVPFIAFSYDYDREILYKNINARVDAMFVNGLKAEVNNLLVGGVRPDAQSMQGIGYKEVVAGITENLSDEEVKETIKRNTRRYAKRQITWFKRLENINYIKPQGIKNDLEAIEEITNGRNAD